METAKLFRVEAFGSGGFSNWVRMGIAGVTVTLWLIGVRTLDPKPYMRRILAKSPRPSK